MNAINPSGLWKKKLGDWAVNPYLGCEHGCFHCYVPTMPGSALFSGPVIDAEGVYHEQPPPRNQRDWGNYIFLKAGFVEALQRQLKTFTPEVARERALTNRASNQQSAISNQQLADWFEPGWILVSFLTDCYTPLEGKFKVTRQVLQLLLEAGHKVRIQTRSAMVERDFDLLRRFPDQVLLGTSIPYLDDEIARVLEPRSSSPTRRLMMIGNAVRAGIKCYVAIAPVMPFTSMDDLRYLFDLLGGFLQDKVALKEIFCEVLNPKGDNVGMMTDAVSKAWMKEPAIVPGAEPENVSKKLARAWVSLEGYNEESWARRTAAVLKFGHSVINYNLSAPRRFMPWPDTSRRWAKYLHERDVAFLDQFLPPRANTAGGYEIPAMERM